MVDTRTGRGNATVQTLAKFRSNPLALWRGYTALAGRNLPFTALQFPMFERMKEYLKAYRDRTGTRTGSLAESGMITAISAGSAGSIAAVVTTPIDLIKTRIMLSAVDASKPKSDAAPNTLVDALGNTQTTKEGSVNAIKKVAGKSGRQSSIAILREIIAQEGMRGIWRGGALRAVWTMVGSGLYLGVYESGRIWLARRRGEDVNADDLF
ncbi:Mitochondrial substrate/solute carrier [Macrophomina phaseolina MS6]|uniref:Mitochondrial substrate/solute carrier n=2 Tax=Macrophomina phaseolina TaxID=35725 RepID=K2S9X5_MACPH|nr:Mitochondrial substrate/solute carrier [Macrophomina phaseolina MS6]